MKNILLTCLLLLPVFLPAQSFYVAFVKGKVYYQDALVKPRTKIELKGELRYSTKDDYVKISGPSGIHTLRPQEKSDGGYEFLQAVTQELFPNVKAKGSFVLSAWSNKGDVLHLYDRSEYMPDYFIEGERRSLNSVLKSKDYDQLYWIYETKEGDIHQEAATVVGDDLLITPKSFRGASGNTCQVAGGAYLFVVRKPAALSVAIESFSLKKLSYSTNPDLTGMAETNSYGKEEMDKNGNPAAGRFFPDLVGLGEIVEPEKIVAAADVFPDMMFLLLESGQQDIRLFVINNFSENVDSYDDLLRRQYGEMDFYSVTNAFVDYLKAHQSEDDRIPALLKAYRKDTRKTKTAKRDERSARKAFYRLLKEE